MCMKTVLITVLFCLLTQIACSAVDLGDNIEEIALLQQIESSTSKDVLSWTPDQVASKLRLGSEEIVFRVRKGEEAEEKQFPYQISFRRQQGNSHWFVNFCGGALVSDKVILTAAHCFRDPKACDSCCMSGVLETDRLFHIYAVAGSLYSLSHFHGNNDTAEFGQWRSLKSGYYPKNFKYPDNDIAVLFTNRNFVFTDYVKAIPMASVQKEYNRRDCLLSGYGKTPEGVNQKILMYAKLRVLNSELCNKLHNRKMPNNVCTADAYIGITKGDAGGPLACKKTGDPNEDGNLGVLIGIAVTADTKVAKEGSLFTRVSSFNAKDKDFIRKSIKTGDGSQLAVSFVATSIPFFILIYTLAQNL